MRCAYALLSAALLLCFISSVAQAEGSFAREHLAGCYRRDGSTFYIELRLKEGGTYRMSWVSDMGADKPRYGIWRLRRSGKVVLISTSKEGQRTADILGPLSIIPDGRGGLMLVGDKELVRFSQPKAAAFRRVLPDAPFILDND